MKNLTFNEWLKLRDEKLHEGIFDTVKNYGKNAALAGAMMGSSAMMGNSFNQGSAMDNIQVSNQKIDNHAAEGEQLSPEEWQKHASRYTGNRGGGAFVPNPKVVGQWIPAGGANKVRVQSRTQVNNDELTQDDIGLTPYRNGKAIGRTNVSSLK